MRFAGSASCGRDVAQGLDASDSCAGPLPFRVQLLDKLQLTRKEHAAVLAELLKHGLEVLLLCGPPLGGRLRFGALLPRGLRQLLGGLQHRPKFRHLLLSFFARLHGLLPRQRLSPPPPSLLLFSLLLS